VIRYIIRRLLWAGVLFLAVTVVAYVIFYIIPVDPARASVGQRATPDEVKRAAHYLGTDRPVYVQYGKFLWRLVHGNLGRSFQNRRAVTDIVLEAAPVTGSVVLGAVILWMLMALPIGILSALRPRSLLDRSAMTFVLLGISMHPVWIGLLLSYFVGYRLAWTPIAGYADFFNPSPGQPGGLVQWAWHLILPWLTIAILNAALYVRMIRSNVMETMNEDYVRTARAKGAPESRVMRSHVLRNAMLPVVTMLGMDIGLLLGGAIFSESVFGLQGLGKTAVQALEHFDLPTTEGILVFATIAIISFNLVVDLLYAVIDPRIRLA
jgi:peptide/nickel transport system permease protein